MKNKKNIHIYLTKKENIANFEEQQFINLTIDKTLEIQQQIKKLIEEKNKKNIYIFTKTLTQFPYATQKKAINITATLVADLGYAPHIRKNTKLNKKERLYMIYNITTTALNIIRANIKNVPKHVKRRLPHG